MSKINAIPYRTPACDKHLRNNESDVCPWCRYDELLSVLKAQARLLEENRRCIERLQGQSGQQSRTTPKDYRERGPHEWYEPLPESDDWLTKVADWIRHLIYWR